MKKSVLEIFNQPSIKEIERQIIGAQCDVERSGYDDKDSANFIKRMLPIRRNLMNREFVLDDDYKRLLSEFNDALQIQLLKMRKETIKAYNAVKSTGVEGDIEATGKCFLGYELSSIHPVHNMRAKKM